MSLIWRQHPPKPYNLLKFFVGLSSPSSLHSFGMAYRELPEGGGVEGGGVLEKNPFLGGGMDIFWNYTINIYQT